MTVYKEQFLLKTILCMCIPLLMISITVSFTYAQIPYLTPPPGATGSTYPSSYLTPPPGVTGFPTQTQFGFPTQASYLTAPPGFTGFPTQTQFGFPTQASYLTAPPGVTGFPTQASYLTAPPGFTGSTYQGSYLTPPPGFNTGLPAQLSYLTQPSSQLGYPAGQPFGMGFVNPALGMFGAQPGLSPLGAVDPFRAGLGLINPLAPGMGLPFGNFSPFPTMQQPFGLNPFQQPMYNMYQQPIYNNPYYNNPYPNYSTNTNTNTNNTDNTSTEPETFDLTGWWAGTWEEYTTDANQLSGDIIVHITSHDLTTGSIQGTVTVTGWEIYDDQTEATLSPAGFLIDSEVAVVKILTFSFPDFYKWSAQQLTIGENSISGTYWLNGPSNYSRNVSISLAPFTPST